jgi:molybdopterin-guanine dinucleotide biosynthesis protein A
MKAGDKETTDTGIDHNAGITSDNVALNVSGAILVGGAGRRLGGAVKPSLRVGSDTIIDRQIRAFRDAGIANICLVGRWPDAPLSSAGVHHVADAVEGAGALGGLYTALLVGSGTTVVVIAGDMPFITAPWLRMLADVGSEDAKVPRAGAGWHPLSAAYRRRVAGRLKRRLDGGLLRVQDALGELRVREVTAPELESYDLTGMLLMNVNTPDDYREATRLAGLNR